MVLIEFFLLPRAFRVKKSGFTLVEVIITACILAMIFGALFSTLNIGYISTPVSLEKLELQAKVRRYLDWIVKDVRQAISWEIASNAPTTSKIKFKPVVGWDNSYPLPHNILSDDFIEYEYDANAQKIIRRTIDSGNNILQAWEFTDIIEEPFYTDYPNRELDGLDLQGDGRLTIVITASKQARGAITIQHTIQEEVKIRNE